MNKNYNRVNEFHAKSNVWKLFPCEAEICISKCLWSVLRWLVSNKMVFLRYVNGHHKFQSFTDVETNDLQVFIANRKRDRNIFNKLPLKMMK